MSASRWKTAAMLTPAHHLGREEGLIPMAECAHGLEFGCTFCSGRETTDLRILKPAPRIPNLWIENRGRVDHELVIAEKVAAGVMCPVCLVEYKPRGCKCQAAWLYETTNREATTWAGEQVEDCIMEPKTAATYAYTANRRARLKAGCIDQATADADRRAIAETCELEPFKSNWRPFRRQEQDYLPV
jgi:hypothetical protein